MLAIENAEYLNRAIRLGEIRAVAPHSLSHDPDCLPERSPGARPSIRAAAHLDLRVHAGLELDQAPRLTDPSLNPGPRKRSRPVRPGPHP